MEEKKISENLSYWRLAPPVRKKFFFPLHSVILTVALSISLVFRSDFLATVSFGSWSNGLGLDRHFV